MTENQRPVVEKIIEAFRSQLSDSVCEQIGSAKFTDLAIMIDEAIAGEMGSAADLVEEVARKLRVSARGSDLGL